MRYSLAICTALLAILIFAAATPLQAQSGMVWDPTRIQLGRAELTAMLERFTATSNSTAYSESFRGNARAEIDLIRKRLAEGDFGVGDQVVLAVAGEPTLTGTFTVRPGRVLTLPDVGDIRLEGVLRSELEQHLRKELARFLRDPQVQAHALMRITISGAVGQPGFFMVPAQSLLTEAMMQAGGMSPTANLEKIRIERTGVPIWTGPSLQQAISQGATLDQLSIRAGDQVIVPTRAPGGRLASAGPVTAIISAVALLFGAFRALR